LIEGLVGFAIDGVACQAELAFLHDTAPNAKRIERYLRDLQRLPPPAELADKVELTERFVFLEAVQFTARDGIQFLQKLPGAREFDMPAERIPEGINWDLALRN